MKKITMLPLPLRRAVATVLCLLFLAWTLSRALLPTGGEGDPFPSGGEIPTADAPPATAEQALLVGLISSAESIDLSPFSLPAESLSALYTRVVYGEPSLFYVAPRLAYRYTEGTTGRLVTEVYPVYTLTGNELAAAGETYFSAVTTIAAEARAALGLGGHSSPLTAAEQASAALYLHDCLAAAYDYDTRPSGEANRDAYRLFRDGVGVCQAYALAYLALCRAVGLEADFVSSTAMDHAWNHVRIGDAWYHVDVTRDDPIPADGAEGGAGVVDHNRFLRSDAGMAALGYHGYTCPSGHTCTDTSFETAISHWSDGEAVENSQGAAESDGTVKDSAATGVAWGSLHRSPMVILRAGGVLTWVGVATEGAVAAYRLEEVLFFLSVGDLDGDGAITPGDLLACALPPDAGGGFMAEARAACLSRLRAMLVGGA